MLAYLNTRRAVMHGDWETSFVKRFELPDAKPVLPRWDVLNRPLVEGEKIKHGVMTLWVDRDTLAGDRHVANARCFPATPTPSNDYQW